MTDTTTDTYDVTTTRTVTSEAPGATVIAAPAPATTEAPRRNSLVLLIMVALFAVMAVWLVASMAGDDDMVPSTTPAAVVTPQAIAPATLPTLEGAAPVADTSATDNGTTTTTTTVPVTNPAD